MNSQTPLGRKDTDGFQETQKPGGVRSSRRRLKIKKMPTIKTQYHSTLASYFASKPLYLDEPIQKKPNTRKLVEQPWQQTKAEMWDEVTNTLCNLDFIQAKASARMTYELVNDFNEVMEVIPDNAENICEEKERQARMDKYTQDLIACAKGEITINELEIPESITPWTKEQTEAEIVRIKMNPTRADKLKDFINFLGQEGFNLQRYSNEIQHLAIQQAWNYAKDGYVGIAAESNISEIYKFIFRRCYYVRPPWNPNPQIMRILKGHRYGVYETVMTPDGKWALSGSEDQSCIFWNLKTGQILQTLKEHKSTVYAVAMTPDGQKAISGSDDNTCILWELKTRQHINKLEGHTSAVMAVAITADGAWAISGSKDYTCILWDLKTGRQVLKLQGHSPVRRVQMTPDVKIAVSGHFDGSILLWDLKTGKQIRILKGHSHFIKAISITPDGKWLFSGSEDCTCILWDLKTGQQIQKIEELLPKVLSATISPDGQIAVTSGSNDKSCILWNLRTRQQIIKLKGHFSSVNSVEITPDGRFAISSSLDNTSIFWNVEKGQETKSLPRHTSAIESIAITPDFKKIISGSGDNSCILWDITTGQKIQTLEGHWFTVHCVAISPDGEHAISGANDHTCILWDIKTGQKIQTLEGHNDTVVYVSFTPDGMFAISSSGTSILWNLGLDQENYPNRRFVNVHLHGITPDGKKAIGSYWTANYIIFDLKTGQSIQVIKHRTSASVQTIEITTDGKKAILGFSDGTITIWDLKSEQQIQIFKYHSHSVNSITITPDSKRAISGSRDSTSVLWDIESGQQIAKNISNSEVNSVINFPKGIVLGCDSGEIIILEVDRSLLCPGKAIVTIKQIWNFKLKSFTHPLAYCPLCGFCFQPPIAIIQKIIKILHENNIKPEQSPCFELPDEAWEHPGLIGECPSCHEPLKFNPFFGSDQKMIEDYLSEHERVRKWRIIFDDAENAFQEQKWEEAYKLYLKLVQQGYFDANYMRYNMAICQVNKINNYNPEIINDINILIKLLHEKGANDKSQMIEVKLKERLETIRQEELLKKKAEASWWKKMFGN